jgi:hypothetical protein
MREERPGLGAMPQRNFGMSGYTMTRPLIESTLRRRALLQPNVAIRQDMQVIGVETFTSWAEPSSARLRLKHDSPEVQ